MSYTPINKFRLTSEGKEVMKDVEKWIERTSVINISISSKSFDLLYNCISPSSRYEYIKAIPYNGRIIVRGK